MALKITEKILKKLTLKWSHLDRGLNKFLFFSSLIFFFYIFFFESLDKARRDVENSKKQIEQFRIQNDLKRQNEAYKALVYAEEKTQKYEKELDDARLSVNEKYDRYTEGLFKRVSEETDLANCYLDVSFRNLKLINMNLKTSFHFKFLKQQQRFHAQVCKNLEEIIPEIAETINNYPKKPVFSVSLKENLRVSTSINPNDVSPVIRKLIESMVRQNAFSEEVRIVFFYFIFFKI
jgi:hypothetical protein